MGSTFRIALLLALVLASGCALVTAPGDAPAVQTAERVAVVMLHGKPLELHVSAPRVGAGKSGVLVLYASGDGGWFGTAIGMFRHIAAAGYATVGFSARTFLKIDRPKGSLVNPAQLTSEYRQILAAARQALDLAPDTPVVLTGWSRGAAFAVLVASEPGASLPLKGVVAIGLSDTEDLDVDTPEDEGDDGPTTTTRARRFAPYTRLADLDSVPCVVIQATRDQYLGAARARTLFGPDTPTRRFYTIDANNHRFSGGEVGFRRALIDAIDWISSAR
jgi:dienelactone hydrolase